MPLHHDAVNRIKYADPVDPWATVSTPWGELPAWKAAALAGGAMNIYDRVRNDAVEAQSTIADVAARERNVAAREDACYTRERKIAAAVKQVAVAADRAAAAWDRAQQLKADAERAAEPPLPLPPGAAGDDLFALAGPEHTPGGELSAVPAKSTAPAAALGCDAALPGDPSLPALTPQEPEFPTDPQLPEPPLQQSPIAAGLD
jgi:hypothetical protein